MGEWLGGFPGVLLAGLGAYAIQALTLSWLAPVALTAHALVCTAMLVMHLSVDAPADAVADPPKRTTVVVLGPRFARAYAAAMAVAAALVYAALALAVQFAFAVRALLTALAAVSHARVRPEDLGSVTRRELQVIQLSVAAGLSTSVLLAPVLWPLLPLAVIGYFLHLFVVAPPASLARAWRRIRKASSEEGNSPGPLSGP